MPGEPSPLIRRKQRSAKRRAQDVAFDLLRESSFDDITVEQIAAGCDLSPSTVYRYFTTKEGVFLWDERDDAVIDAFRERLRTLPPGAAMLEAVSGMLVDNEAGSDAVTLDRHRTIAATPILRAAREGQHAMLRQTLADVIVESGWREPQASTFAGAVVGAFAGAIEAWQRAGGLDDLADIIAVTADLVGNLDRLFSATRQP